MGEKDRGIEGRIDLLDFKIEINLHVWGRYLSNYNGFLISGATKKKKRDL